MGVSIFNGGFGMWLDGAFDGTVDAEGERRAPPWWMRNVHDCLVEWMLPSGAWEWCAEALLTVHDWPPATPRVPPAPATVVITVGYFAPPSECTITYKGALERYERDG